MSLYFDERRHLYFQDGQPLPSVTQIIDALGLGPDYSKIPPATLQAKARIGTATHQACQEMIRGTYKISANCCAAPYINGFDRFITETRYHQLGGEEPLADPERGYAGTPDSWGILNGWLLVVDFKTAVSLHVPTAALQVVAYSHLLAHAGKLGARGVDGLYALHLKPNAYKLVNVGLPGAEATWASALAEYHGRGTPQTAAMLRHWKDRHETR